MRTVDSFNIQIFCGLKEGYSGKTHDIEDVERLMQKFVDAKKECVTITATKFVYTDGNEPGVIVGLINYPRFPKFQHTLKERAFEIAKILMVTFKQNRVTVTMPNESFMLEQDDVKNEL
jgi:hypothetical protein